MSNETLNIIQDQSAEVTLSGEKITINVIKSQTVDSSFNPISSASNDFILGNGTTFVKKTLAETKTVLGLQENLISFNSEIICSNKGGNYATAPSGNLTFTNGTGHVSFGFVRYKVVAESGRTLTFTTGDFIDINSSSSNYDDTVDCYVYFWKDPAETKILYSLVASDSATDITSLLYATHGLMMQGGGDWIPLDADVLFNVIKNSPIKYTGNSVGWGGYFYRNISAVSNNEVKSKDSSFKIMIGFYNPSLSKSDKYKNMNYAFQYTLD